MKVLITGGAGFIGGHVSRRLVEAEIPCVALDSLSAQVHRDPEASLARFPGEVIVGDVRDADAVLRAAAGCSAIIHLAAETGTAQSMALPNHYHDVNVGGTEVVASAAARSGIPLILASSRAVYGEGAYACPAHGRTLGGPCCATSEPTASREEDSPRPVSVYGQSKIDAEAVVARLRPEGLCWVAVRPQNVLGPGQAPHNPYTGVLAAFAARLRAEQPPLVFGDGSQTRDFVDVRDVAASVDRLLTAACGEEMPGLITVNLGSGRRTSLLELATLAANHHGGRLAPVLVDVSRAGDIAHACGDTARAAGLAIPEPAIPLPVSVGDFLDFAWGEPVVDPSLWDRALDEAGTSAS